MEHPLSSGAATTAGVLTFVLLGVAWGLRLAFRTFWKDKVEVNVAGGINDAVTLLRHEVDRLDKRVQSISKAEQEFKAERDLYKNERDQLDLRVQHLNHRVKILTNLLIEVLGAEAAEAHLKTFGIGLSNEANYGSTVPFGSAEPNFQPRRD